MFFKHWQEKIFGVLTAEHDKLFPLGIGEIKTVCSFLERDSFLVHARHIARQVPAVHERFLCIATSDHEKSEEKKGKGEPEIHGDGFLQVIEKFYFLIV